jgi:dTDP-4-amino-4,6-dideoxygalactose transaminase
MYYLLLPDLDKRAEFMRLLKAKGVDSVFHYVPLHSSVAGERFGRAHGTCATTDVFSERLVRLPLWLELTDEMIATVIATVVGVARSLAGSSPRQPGLYVSAKR